MRSQDKKAEIDLLDKLITTDSYAFESGLKNRRKQLELLHLTEANGQRLLDAGCGPGTYGIILAMDGYEVIGVDISYNAMKVAKGRADQKAVPFLPLAGDLEKLPFEDNSFDICFCGYTLHHFQNIDSVVAEFTRVLKPGGKILFLEPNGSNFAINVSRRLESLVRGWLFRLGIDSLNETLHRHTVYTEALAKHEFTDIQVASSYTGGLPPLPSKKLQHTMSYRISLFFIRALAHLRLIFYAMISKILPRPLNGIDLMISATKRKQR